MEHEASFNAFIHYFTAMSQLERYGELNSLISTLDINAEEEIVTFSDQPMFKYFGHLDTTNDMYEAIQVAPESRVLDGSEPIVLTSRQKSFGLYDDEVSPIVEQILKKGKSVATFYWQLKFSFQQVGDSFIFCSITGNKTTSEGDPSGSSTFTGTTFGPDVKSSLESVLTILPSILGVPNA